MHKIGYINEFQMFFFVCLFVSAVIRRLTSTVQLFTGDYVAQDFSIGFTRFIPAELQGIRTKCSEDQGAGGTGGAQSER